MKAKKLYQEIGNIDDSLIEDAADAQFIHKAYNKKMTWLAAAACLVVIAIISILNIPKNDTVHINEINGLMNANIFIDETIYKETLTQEDVWEYLDIQPLPSELFVNLHLYEQNEYYIYYNNDNSVYYDVSQFYYYNINEENERLQIKLSKSGYDYGTAFYGVDNVVESKINNTSVIIGRFNTPIDINSDKTYETHVAEFENGGAYYTVIAEGIDEDAFIEVISQIIKR